MTNEILTKCKDFFESNHKKTKIKTNKQTKN